MSHSSPCGPVTSLPHMVTMQCCHLNCTMRKNPTGKLSTTHKSYEFDSTALLQLIGGQFLVKTVFLWKLCKKKVLASHQSASSIWLHRIGRCNMPLRCESDVNRWSTTFLKLRATFWSLISANGYHFVKRWTLFMLKYDHCVLLTIHDIHDIHLNEDKNYENTFS